MPYTFTRDENTVVSYPGSDRSLKSSNLAKGSAILRPYYNWCVGEFFKELNFTEGRGTGIPKILHAMKENCSPPPEVCTDDDHTFFATVLPLYAEAKVAAVEMATKIRTNLTLPR